MNWYEIFYWVTVADNVKSFFDTTSNIFTWFAVLSFIAFIFCIIWHSVEHSSNKDDDDNDVKAARICKRAFGWVFYVSLGLSLVTWFGYMACPSKKDALIIIAGGAVGNFITSDTTISHIPGEMTLLIRDKIRAEMKEVNLQNVINDKLAEQVDTLSGKSKEELMQIIKDQNK